MAAEDAVPAPIDSGAARNITSRTAAIYAAQGEPDGRAEALAALLHDFALLPAERQHDAYASFGRVAEATGDLEYAEEAYWRATSVAADPTGRASDLVAHARVLLARGNRAAAVAELEEALVLAPRHTGAMTLLAEESFQIGDWERARHLYALLAPLEPPFSQRQTGPWNRQHTAVRPSRAQTILLRRARLARDAGDLREAEDCYAALAALDADAHRGAPRPGGAGAGTARSARRRGSPGRGASAVAPRGVSESARYAAAAGGYLRGAGRLGGGAPLRRAGAGPGSAAHHHAGAIDGNLSAARPVVGRRGGVRPAGTGARGSAGRRRSRCCARASSGRTG